MIVRLEDVGCALERMLRPVEHASLAWAVAACTGSGTTREQASVARKREHVVGRRCAITALALLGVPGVSELATHPSGAAHWPSGYIGSISHCAEVAIALVARDSELAAIGVDVERIAYNSLARGIAGLVVSERERRLISGVTAELDRQTTLSWSAKEAAFKALSSRLVSPPELLELQVVDSDSSRRLLRVAYKDINVRDRHLATVDVSFEWVDGAVVTACLLPRATAS